MGSCSSKNELMFDAEPMQLKSSETGGTSHVNILLLGNKDDLKMFREGLEFAEGRRGDDASVECGDALIGWNRFEMTDKINVDTFDAVLEGSELGYPKSTHRVGTIQAGLTANPRVHCVCYLLNNSLFKSIKNNKESWEIFHKRVIYHDVPQLAFLPDMEEDLQREIAECLTLPANSVLPISRPKVVKLKLLLAKCKDDLYSSYKDALREGRTDIKQESYENQVLPSGHQQSEQNTKQAVAVQLYSHNKGEETQRFVDELSHRLKRSNNITLLPLESPTDIDNNFPAIVLCVLASRLEHDLGNAFSGIKVERNVACILLHYKMKSKLPRHLPNIPPGYYDIGTVIHMASFQDEVMYQCDMNTKGFQQLVSHIEQSSRHV